MCIKITPTPLAKQCLVVISIVAKVCTLVGKQGSITISLVYYCSDFRDKQIIDYEFCLFDKFFLFNVQHIRNVIDSLTVQLCCVLADM